MYSISSHLHRSNFTLLQSLSQRICLPAVASGLDPTGVLSHNTPTAPAINLVLPKSPTYILLLKLKNVTYLTIASTENLTCNTLARHIATSFILTIATTLLSFSVRFNLLFSQSSCQPFHLISMLPILLFCPFFTVTDCPNFSLTVFLHNNLLLISVFAYEP